MTAQDYCLWDDPLCYAKEKSPSILCYLLLLFFHQFPLKLESEFYVWQLGNVCPPGRMIWSFGFSEKKMQTNGAIFVWMKYFKICWFFWKYKRATFFFFLWRKYFNFSYQTYKGPICLEEMFSCTRSWSTVHFDVLGSFVKDWICSYVNSCLVIAKKTRR